jgi:dihydrodipicolinate synthase/N-acetylneuraminate lyase
MDRNDVDWRGYWAAVPTPYAEDGSLALDLLRELLDLYVGMGLHGVLVNGTTGEWFSQSAEERMQVAETAIDAIGGRIPIVIGCTSYTAEQVVAFAGHAIDHGAAGFSSTAPPYAKPFDDEIVAFYEDIAEGIPEAPMMIYNWPHGTSVELGTDLALRLTEIDSVVAFKDSTPNVEQFYASSRAVIDRVRVFGPYMTTAGYGELRAYGGDGTIGGGCLFGAPDPGFWEDHWRGDEDAALAHAKRNEDLFPKLWLPGGWAGQHGHYASELKALMAILGQPGGTVRRPRLPITDPAKLAEMRAVLTDAGLLGAGVSG